MDRLRDGSRYSYGADEFVFVELSEEMSLETTLKVIAITDELRHLDVPGLLDICPAHVSYMVRVDPDVLDPRHLLPVLAGLHERGSSTQLAISARLIELPVYYDDPWTRETLMRFRDRHQDPAVTDLEYCARVNGFASTDDLVEAHSSAPFIATFIGFMPGNAESYQLVPQHRQLEAPKYLRPRTDTPARALGHGGAFTTIYPVQGAGGFQLLGRCAVPVFDVEHRLPDFGGDIVLPRAGDIFKYRSVDEQEYLQIRSEVEDGSYRYRIEQSVFDLTAFAADPESYIEQLLEVLADDRG